MTQITKRNPAILFPIGFACLALSGCQVFGHPISNGIWFPIILVVSFIVFIVWRIMRHGSRRGGPGKTVASGWVDGDASGHGGHTQMHDDGGGDDGSGHHG